MESRSSALTPGLNRREEDYEKMLRPQTLDEFIGQQKIKDNLRVFMTAALQRGETLDHVLLSGPPGLGKCITPDSLILTSQGWVVFDELIPDGMGPDTSRPLEVEVFGVHGLEKTSHIYASGRVETRRLRTRAGFTLEGTPHHPVLVATPEGPRWKPLGALSTDDYVAVGRGLDMWGTAPQTIAQHAAPRRREAVAAGQAEAFAPTPMPLETQASRAAPSGDGQALIDPANLELAVSPAGQAGRGAVLDDGAAYCLGVAAAEAHEEGIPATILKSPRNVVISFLQGLFDAAATVWPDGYVELGTRAEALARHTQLMLANLGVIAHRTDAQEMGAAPWRLLIGGEDAARFFETVGFRLDEKRALAERRIARSRGWSRSDQVPCANGLLRALLHKSQPHSRAVEHAFKHVDQDDRTPTRRQIARYLSLLPEAIREEPEYRTLASLANRLIYWDRVAETTVSEAEAFDFVVPGTHSFVANGLFNHNTTLGYIIAEEMGAGITTTSGPVLDKPASIAGILTNLNEGDVLFIDEIHRLSPIVEEYLYSAMEDYHIDIMIDSGPNARSVKITLPPFTLVGATTRKGLLTAPLRARFGIDFRYDYYTANLLQMIVLRSARILGVEIDNEGAFEIARRSRGTPRISNRLLRRTRDFAEVESDGRINSAIADHALNALDVDEEGLDDMDARILMTLIEKFNGGPTGLSNLAVSVGEDPGTIEEVYEPYLIQEGYLERTARGRIATPRSYAHFGLEPPAKTGDLFGKG